MLEVNRTTIDNTENLDFVAPMYSLLEFSPNYSNTIGSLSFCSSKDEATNFNNDMANTDDFKSFKHKAKLLGNTVAQPASKHANRTPENLPPTAMPLKYLINFWGLFEIPLIIYKS